MTTWDNESKLSTNLQGETWRELSFQGSGFGCYSSFDINPELIQVEIQELENKFPKLLSAIKEHGWFWLPEENKWDLVPQCFISKDGNFAMLYRWSNDGYLSFSLKDKDGNEKVIYNTDCKKQKWQDFDQI